jgi:hypothetical protein
MSSLSKLENISLDTLKMKSPPVSVCSGGTLEIMKYLKKLMLKACDPKFCFAFGSGLAAKVFASENEQFTIKAVDNYGINKDCGDDVFEVLMVSDDSSLILKPEDNQDGSYSVTYDARKSGNYTISVRNANENIKSSPFFILIEHDTPCNLSLHAENFDWNNIKTGKYYEFEIIALDKFGNLCKNADISISVFNKKFDSSNVVLESTNTMEVYKTSLLFKKTGKYSVEIYLNGEVKKCFELIATDQ